MDAYPLQDLSALPTTRPYPRADDARWRALGGDAGRECPPRPRHRASAIRGSADERAAAPSSGKHRRRHAARGIGGCRCRLCHSLRVGTHSADRKKGSADSARGHANFMEGHAGAAEA